MLRCFFLLASLYVPFQTMFCAASSIRGHATRFRNDHADGIHLPYASGQPHVLQASGIAHTLKEHKPTREEDIFLNEGPDPSFHAVQNVADSTFRLGSPVTRLVRTRLDKIDDRADYFMIETMSSNDAFGHWVWESAIFLPSFIEFKRSNPRLHLVLRSKKAFKQLFTDFFGIQEEDLLYIRHVETGDSQVKDSLPSSNNWCVFPPTISLNSINDEALHSWEPYFNNMIRELRGRRGTPCPSCHHERIPYLFLPRQSKENYATNERQINYTDIHDAIHNAGGEIMNTDDVSDLTTQIRKIQAADVIILDDGSSLMFNGLVAENKTIYALGSGFPLSLPFNRHWIERIKSENNFIHIAGQFSAPKNYVFSCSMIAHLQPFCI